MLPIRVLLRQLLDPTDTFRYLCAFEGEIEK